MKLQLLAIILTCLSLLPLRSDVEIAGFENLALDLAPQEDPVACWAASMSAALKVKNIDLSQDAIKLAVNGNTNLATLTDPRLLTKGMNQLMFGQNQFKGLFVTVPQFHISWADFQTQIQSGNPFLLGYWISSTNAHCVVIYGMQTDANDNPIAYKIWDPEPATGGLSTLSLGQVATSTWFFVILKDASLTPVGNAANTTSNNPASSSQVNGSDDDFSGNVSANSDAAGDISLRPTDHVTWHPTLNDSTVDYSLSYENTGDKTITCEIKVAVGTVDREGTPSERTASWNQTSSKVYKFTVEAGNIYHFHGTQPWVADSDLMPRIQYPDPSIEKHPELYRCDYTP